MAFFPQLEPGNHDDEDEDDIDDEDSFMLRLELGTSISWDLATFLLGKNRDEFQANTTFSKRNTEWWEASSYRVEDGTLFFMPTNLARVSYLDLEQHSHTFPEEYDGFLFLWTLLSEDEKLKDLKNTRQDALALIDEVPKGNVERLEKAFIRLLSQYYSLVKYTMDVEYYHRMYEEIKAHYDADRLKRFLKYCLDQDFLPERQTCCEMIIDLLEIHNVNDSAFVIEIFTAICEHYIKGHCIFITQLPSNLIQFYGRHLKRIGAEFGDIFGHWFHREDLMVHAIFYEDLEKIKKLVEWKFPSGLLPFAMTPSAAQLVRNSWPRLKNGVKLHSYHSLEYFSMFFTFLGLCVLSAHEKLNGLGCVDLIKRGFQTFWRAVPTPHLPFSDVAACLHKLVGTYPDHMPIDEESLEGVLYGIELLLENEEEYRHDVYAPRSLQHLCRCVVRERCSTPERIERLPVADGVKSYLRLEK